MAVTLASSVGHVVTGRSAALTKAAATVRAAVTLPLRSPSLRVPGGVVATLRRPLKSDCQLRRARVVTTAAADMSGQATPPVGLLKDKWCLVTGASRGIGAATAKAFAGQDAKLIITSEEAQKADLDKTAEECRQGGAAEVKVIYADLALSREVDRLAQESLQAAGGTVDVLVNNAGSMGPLDFDKGSNKGQGPLDGDPAEWERIVAINLSAPMRLTRQLAPPMVEQQDGHIVNVCSIEALSGYPTAPAYSTTKWGLKGWSLGCQTALKSDGVKVIVVNPAQTSTPMTWDRPDAEYIPELEIQPEDIAEAILLTFRTAANAFVSEITIHTAKKPKKEK